MMDVDVDVDVLSKFEINFRHLRHMEGRTKMDVSLVRSLHLLYSLSLLIPFHAVVMLCYVMLCYVMLCYVIWCQKVSDFGALKRPDVMILRFASFCS
jgi:hypothetical protein